MGIELQDEDISTAHRLPTYNKSAEDKITVKFTRRTIRDEFYEFLNSTTQTSSLTSKVNFLMDKWSLFFSFI